MPTPEVFTLVVQGGCFAIVAFMVVWFSPRLLQRLDKMGDSIAANTAAVTRFTDRLESFAESMKEQQETYTSGRDRLGADIRADVASVRAEVRILQEQFTRWIQSGESRGRSST